VSGLKVAIMQPYFLPYIGYFQLIAAVDEFVIYDNIEYTKKGWINRNRFLVNGVDQTFTIPLKKDSDYLQVRQREISQEMCPEKLLNQFRETYRKAPYFEFVYPMVVSIVKFEERNLFTYINNSVFEVCRYIGIETPIVACSKLGADHSLKGQARVISICKSLGATHYVNPIGGQTLYSARDFADEGIALSFLKSQSREYPQFGGVFLPSLSILDVMMFNSREVIQEMLQEYEISKPEIQ
jgi:hypothetical protein